MKFTIKKNALLTTLTSVGRAASNFSPLPILSGIKFELTMDRLILTASDSSISIREEIIADDKNELKIIEEGAVVLDSRYAIESVRKLNVIIFVLKLLMER